jgi:hypothetical protein
MRASTSSVRTAARCRVRSTARAAPASVARRAAGRRAPALRSGRLAAAGPRASRRTLRCVGAPPPTGCARRSAVAGEQAAFAAAAVQAAQVPADRAAADAQAEALGGGAFEVVRFVEDHHAVRPAGSWRRPCAAPGRRSRARGSRPAPAPTACAGARVASGSGRSACRRAAGSCRARPALPPRLRAAAGTAGPGACLRRSCSDQSTIFGAAGSPRSGSSNRWRSRSARCMRRRQT